MANVIVRCSNFAGNYARVNGLHSRNINRVVVMRAIITLGAQRWTDVLSLGFRGLLFRWAIGLSLHSLLKQSTAGLCMADEYHSLDMSEKGITSYWYGMAFAKIVADTELGVRWLAHVDKMLQSGAMANTSGSNRRGDLIGLGANNDWHVIEAKGRSGSYPQTLISEAKHQSATVPLIHNQPVATTSACITSLATQPISVLLDDPPPDIGDNVRYLGVSEADFFEEYYRGIIEYLRAFRFQGPKTIANVEFIVAPLPALPSDFLHDPTRAISQTMVGLPAGIFAAPKTARSVVNDLPIDDEGSIGSDGIAIFGTIPEWESA